MALLLDSDICAKAVSQADTRSGAIWRAPRHEKKERSEFFKVSGNKAKRTRGAGPFGERRDINVIYEGYEYERTSPGYQ